MQIRHLVFENFIYDYTPWDKSTIYSTRKHNYLSNRQIINVFCICLTYLQLLCRDRGCLAFWPLVCDLDEPALGISQN